MANELTPFAEIQNRSAAVDGSYSDLEFSRDELVALLRINQALSPAGDRAAIFAAIVGAIDGLLPADQLVVSIPGSQGAADSVYDIHGGTKLSEREHIPEGSVAAWVMSRREAMVISSPEQVRETYPATYERLVTDGIRSGVVLPLLAREHCLGALGFMARAAGPCDGYQRRLLDAITRSVAVALENCFAYEQHQRMRQELSALLDVNRAIGRHLHRDELFGALARCLQSVVPTDRFGVELAIDGDQLQAHLLGPLRATAEPTRAEVLPAAGTACRWVEENRQPYVVSSRDELRERFPVTFQVMQRESMQSLCALPLLIGERCRGVLFFMAAGEGAYGNLQRGLLEQVAGAVAVALDDCLAHEEVQRLRDRLAAENVYLQEEIRQEHNFGEIVGDSPRLSQVLSLVEAVAPTTSTVLISGETGTGKELIARAIHDRSPRRDRPLVKVNCAAISAGLVESELFGHVKGAFTGALATHVGRFELADGGTIFLDEIGDLPPETQVKLLRVLQEREFEPVGSNRPRRVDVRVIAATNRNLDQAVAEGRFRSDLFFRLNVLPIRVPALRERREDIPRLVYFFVERFAREMGKPISGVSRKAMERLVAYDWPGNVRELQNIVERAAVLATGPVLELGPDFLPANPENERSVPMESVVPAGEPESTALQDIGRQHILRVLERCDWAIEGPDGAAHLLGMRPSTLRSRMKKLGLQRHSGAAT